MLNPSGGLAQLARGDHSALLYNDNKIILFGGRNRDQYCLYCLLWRHPVSRGGDI